MRFPCRSPKTIPTPALPSILTLFPADYKERPEATLTAEQSESSIGYGLEVVPIERCNTSCGKTVSPDTEEKEVLCAQFNERNRHTKPLPPLPKAAWKLVAKSKWYRLPVKQRIIALLCVQFGLLSVICLSLLSIKPHLTKRDSSEQSTNTSSSFPPSPSIPVGNFILNLNTPRQQSSACLADSDDADAWTCPSEAVLQVAVSSESPTSQPTLSIRSTNSTDQSSYGEQLLSITATDFGRIYPTDQSDEGPIYRFKGLYDRTILLTETQLSFLGPSQPETGKDSKERISPADRPWLCHFNSTAIEIFVYLSQRAATATNDTHGLHYNDTKAQSSPTFPYVVQISEQWVPNGTRAYCEQQNVSDHGDLRKSDTPKYFLSTADPATRYAPSVPSDTKQQAGIADGTCQCQWLVQ